MSLGRLTTPVGKLSLHICIGKESEKGKTDSLIVAPLRFLRPLSRLAEERPR